MKKLSLTIVIVSFFTGALFGQANSGFEVGLRGAAASNWLFNSNCDAGGTSSYAAAFSYNYGLQVAYNFTPKTAIEVNILMGTITQGYSGKFGTNEYLEYQPGTTTAYGPIPSYYGAAYFGNGESFTSTNQVNVMGIPVLFRFGGGNGSYLEIGPEYQIVQSVNYTSSYSNIPTGMPNYSGTTSMTVGSGGWAASNIQAVLGFGNDFQIGESGWNIITDLRFYYGLTDLGGNDGHGQYLPQTLSNGQSNVLYTQNYGGKSAPYYASYIGTHSAGASFNIGVYYFIPVGNTNGHGACKHLPTVKSH